jgi:hypothetical protein
VEANKAVFPLGQEKGNACNPPEPVGQGTGNVLVEPEGRLQWSTCVTGSRTNILRASSCRSTHSA